MEKKAKKYRAVTREELVSALGTQCSPMSSDRRPRDGTPEGYVIGPDVNGRLCHIATCFTLAEAQQRADESNAREAV